MNTFAEYTKTALTTMQYPSTGNNIVYPALGLVGEAGETADKVKKIWRNTGTMTGREYTEPVKQKIIEELGDVLWYINAMAFELGFDLEYVATVNAEKLLDRKQRGVIKSEGDNR